jgi:tetratricopeptide (TPR) repeat protein
MEQASHRLLYSMFKPAVSLLVALSSLVFGVLAGAQTPAKKPPSSPSSPVSSSRAIELAKTGHCAEALPVLQAALKQKMDKDFERNTGFAGVRCAMFADQPDTAMQFLQFLNREFPHDPDVLYLSVHTYSDLSTRASLQLATIAPQSYQAHELNAEALEAQGKWDEAAKQYRSVLEQNPHLPGIHFRLGRLLLSEPNPPAGVAEQAQQEMQRELEIDPSNSAAEYVLGALAQQNRQWDEAIQHFSRAAKLDAGFGDAFVGLGVCLVSAKRFAEAIAPLETAVELEPKSIAAHYNLAIAYNRSGRKQDGDREFAIHQQLSNNAAVESQPQSQHAPN